MKNYLTILTLFISWIASAQDVSLREPEFINSVLIVKSDGSLAKLEKAIPSQLTKKNAGSMIFGGFDYNDFMQIQGNESSIKVNPMEKYQFIVRVYSNEIDPVEQISIVKMKATRNNRVIKTTSHGLFGAYSSNDMDYVRFNGSKFGESSYLITVNQNLEPGNYAIMIRNVSDVLNVFEVAPIAAIKNDEYKETAIAQSQAPIRESQYNSADQALVGGDFLILGGISFWSGTYGGMPVFVGGDYMLNDKFSLGFEFSYTSYNPYDDILWNGVDGNLTVISFGPRVNYHLMEDLDLSNPYLDIYAGLFVGAVMVSTQIEDSEVTEDGGLGYYAFAGASYQLGTNFLVFSELGYGYYGLKLGAAIKF